MTYRPLITVITASVGHPMLKRCLESVAAQSYTQVQHLVFSDGPMADSRVRSALETLNDQKRRNDVDLVSLPYPVGIDRWNGHRMYAAGTYLARGEYVCFLDDDNFYERDHLESCFDAVAGGHSWSFSYRKIVDHNGVFQCNDDCESLGKWPSVLGETDYFIDVNCYFLPRQLAVAISPIWYRRFREPNQMEVDRALCRALREIAPNYGSNGRYSVNYQVGNSPNSVTLDFFLRGNEEMRRRYGKTLPWPQ